MKKILSIISIAVLLFAVSCKKKEVQKPVEIKVQLTFEGSAFATEGVAVSLESASGTANYEGNTDASGAVLFTVPLGSYTASATYKTSADGLRIVYSGSNSNILVTVAGDFDLPLQKVESQQIIIKELYFGGCQKDDASGVYSDDAYVTLYNNSDVEADASDIVLTFAAPYNANGTNKYYGTDNTLLYEAENWIPAYCAIWWFTSPVTIPPYSQITVAFFGAIDHTATVSASVDLSDAKYYWMSNVDVPQYSMAKYAVSDNIPASNYLSCSPFSMGKAWAISNSAPAFYIGRMSQSEALALSQDSEAYDHTMGTTAAFNVVKFPKAKVVDAVEVWSNANIDKSKLRFTAEINNNYVALTNKLGYSIYRNVDKEATEALAENAGKLVYEYAGGTTDLEGTTDPSGIDAEASIAAGAHVIYSETNDSSKDFHQRKFAALKK